MLKGKHIVLGITGGIAAYKSASLLRLFIKAGAEVQVVMTPSAREFITPVTMSALSGKPVISEFFTANTGEWHSHVDIGLWADAMVIAPATACTIAKMATGVADNMLVTTYLSAKAPVFVAPAMDLDMMRHPSTVRNLQILRSFGNYIIEPAEGELASHLIGKGRMAEPEDIFQFLDEYFDRNNDLVGKKIMITAGPTYERIDSVRFIGNYSSGKMGYALADEAARRGADVTLISGPVNISPKQNNIKIIPIESAREMLAAAQQEFNNTDIAIMCAAVADYAPATVADHKIKREENINPVIQLVNNPDIAASLGEIKKPGQKLIGFALETDNEIDNAIAKIEKKNLDMIVLNSLKVPGTCFHSDNNKVTLLYPDGHSVSYDLKPKTAVATDIINAIRAL